MVEFGERMDLKGAGDAEISETLRLLAQVLRRMVMPCVEEGGGHSERAEHEDTKATSPHPHPPPLLCLQEMHLGVWTRS